MKKLFSLFAAILLVGNMMAYTFTAGTTIYYDFTAVGGGVNYLKVNSSYLDYNANGGGTIIPVTFTADVTVDANTTISKTATGNWAEIKFTSEPTEGQDMIIISNDGKGYTWGTYSGSPEPTEYTIYFKNTVEWENVYVHFYNNSYSMGTNGATGSGAAKNAGAMTKIEDGPYYSLTFSSAIAYTKVCFTKDQQDTYGNFWQTEASYSAALDLEGENILYIPDATTSTTLNQNVPYYQGRWTTYPEPEASSTYTVTVAVNNDEMGSATATVNGETVTEVDPETEVTFTATVADPTQAYFVGWFDNANGTGVAMSTDLTYTKAINADITIYAVFAAYPTRMWIKHPIDGTNWNWYEMVSLGSGIFAYYGEAHATGFNYTINENYTNEAWTGDVIPAEMLGEPVKFVVNFGTKEVSVTAATMTETTYLNGSWDEWANKTDITQPIQLTASETAYQFVIVITKSYNDGAFTVNQYLKAENDNDPMTRDNHENWLIVSEGYNFYLLADKDGAYSFAIDEDGKLDVTYPDITTGIEAAHSYRATKALIDGQLIIIHNNKVIRL